MTEYRIRHKDPRETPCLSEYYRMRPSEKEHGLYIDEVLKKMREAYQK